MTSHQVFRLLNIHFISVNIQITASHQGVGGGWNRTLTVKCSCLAMKNNIVRNLRFRRYCVQPVNLHLVSVGYDPFWEEIIRAQLWQNSNGSDETWLSLLWTDASWTALLTCEKTGAMCVLILLTHVFANTRRIKNAFMELIKVSIVKAFLIN